MKEDIIKVLQAISYISITVFNVIRIVRELRKKD